MNAKQLLLTFIFVLFFSGLLQAKDWRGIVPLHSTRADVEHLLGKPDTDKEYFAFYELGNERVFVNYAKGDCNEKFEVWNVPNSTVISISVTPLPNTVLLLSELNLDLSQFEKVQNEEIGWIVNYINRNEGINVEVENVKNQSRISNITYFNTKKDNYLRCSEKKVSEK